MSPTRRPAILLLFIVICTATAVQADPTPTNDPARAHFDQGQALTASGDFAGAYREFEAGYAANPRPAFLFNMGEAARAMGDVVKARAAYERFIVVQPPGELVDTARQRLAELGPDPASASSSLAPIGTKIPSPSELAGKIDATSDVSLVAKSQPDESQPLWKHWPLWAAVGGVVLTAVVVGVVATHHNDPTCGLGCVDFRN